MARQYYSIFAKPRKLRLIYPSKFEIKGLGPKSAPPKIASYIINLEALEKRRMSVREVMDAIIDYGICFYQEEPKPPAIWNLTHVRSWFRQFKACREPMFEKEITEGARQQHVEDMQNYPWLQTIRPKGLYDFIDRLDTKQAPR